MERAERAPAAGWGCITRVEGGGLAFDHAFVRHVLPHRGRMLLLDRVQRYAYERREIEGVKLVAQDEALLEGRGRGGSFPQTLLVEALAQACGFLMNMDWFIRENGLAPQALLDSAIYRRELRVPPISVLAESRIAQRRRVEPARTITLLARVVLTRGDAWCFAAQASVEGDTVAGGDVMLAYPPYAPPLDPPWARREELR